MAIMLFPQEESSLLEFKRELPKNDQIIKTIIGFANQNGGRLVLGVGNDRKIIGVPEDTIQETMEKIQNSIHDNCHPTLMPSIYTRRFGDKLVIVIEVSKGSAKPYFKKSEGLSKGTYIRLGIVTAKATPEMIQEMQFQSRGITQDALPVYQATTEDQNFEAIQRFLRNKQFPHIVEEPTIEILKSYHLVFEEHSRLYPSVAGLLLFGKNPQHFLTEAFIICSHFKGISGREVIATRDCTGTLFEQYLNSVEFVEERLNRSFTIRGKRREESLEMPLNAIREAILNVIVHRNYRIPGPAKIAIYQDRLELFSPGTFPGPLSIRDLELGISYVRNPIICRIFREAGYIEKLGSGFPTIFSSFKDAGLRQPQVLEREEAIKLILPRGKETRKEKDPESSLLNFLSQKEQVTISEIAANLGVSKATAWRLVKKLISKGTIFSHGKGPGTVYLLSEKN
jgi:ATP-dependent DNA helicase RecG